MSPQPVLAGREWDRFVLPHSLRLVGEHQHLIGAGTVAAASTLWLRVQAEETPGQFSIGFGRWADNETGWTPLDGEDLPEQAVCWEQAMRQALGAGPDELGGLSVRTDFGPLADLVPAGVLAASPAVALALAVAGVAFRGEREQITDDALARLACRLKALADPPGASHPDRFYPEMLQSVLGGAAHVAPDGERLNVQPLLPPDSLLLAIAPDLDAGPVAPEPLARVGEAAELVLQRGGTLPEGDAGLAELFRLGREGLSEEQTGLLYGLMRVREMADAFLECLTEDLVDNDRLAELCDEESAILVDYLGFPAHPYDGIRAAASEAGALGAKLTWAFGGCPAALIVAPGRREQVGRALARQFRRAGFLLVDVAPEGLRPGVEDDEPEEGA